MKFNGLPVAGLVLLLLLSKPIVDRLCPDYMEIAARTPWAWSEDLASAADSAARVPAGRVYRVTSSGDGMPNLSFVVWRGDRRAYEWVGHDGTVFRIVGHRLYYADFRPGSCGGHIAAIDLTTGAQIWREPLLAIGLWGHSKYGNEMNLDADDRTVRVFGNESCGRYYEIKHATTGRTVGHHAYGPMGSVPFWSGVVPPTPDGPPRHILRLSRATLLMLAVVGVLARSIANIRRARRVRAARCVICGYDLRATPDRCPECGIAPSKLGRGG